MVDVVNQEMKEPEPSKTSFKEALLGSRGVGAGEAACLPLVDEEEITLLDDEVYISLDGPYPQVRFLTGSLLN